MRVGTVKERKDGEHRVGLTPEGVSALRSAGHEVLVEAGAGLGSGFEDAAYAQAGAAIVEAAEDVWRTAGLVVKVKEPLPGEYPLLSAETALFTYLHLAAARPLTEHLLAAGTTAIAYELVRDRAGGFPLLAPMSRIAGHMAAEVGAGLLRQPGPGRGKLLTSLPGVPGGRAVVIGAGVVGLAATQTLVGLGARVTMLSRGLPSLAAVQDRFGSQVATRLSTPAGVDEELAGAELTILGVMQAGATAPKVITREQVRSMGRGAVLVDVAIDQGGASETSRPTSHSEPTYLDEGVIHYCVTNMPGAVPLTSTRALSSATLPSILAIAGRGVAGAMAADAGLAAGLCTHRGTMTCPAVAEEFGLTVAPHPFAS